MTDKKKIEFRKMLAEYLVMLSKNESQSDTLVMLEKIEKWIDAYTDSEIGKIIGANSKLKVN
jgi:hypothetical protein